jgi:4-diphosphocytidyl-2-C-methyl-D-erythritol kinase
MTALTQLRLPAPAKINTFLHVVGRRDDGYHLLESVMVFVSLADTVELTLRDDGVVRLLDPPDGITETNDLACRAARALQAKTGCKLGVDIQLTKRIPQGAGLGGGSSDAATTLLGLNRLWQLQLSREQLIQIGLTLGADVPFFVFGRAAFVRGIGESLAAVNFPRTSFVLAHPGVGLATARVFSHPDLPRNTASTIIAPLKLTYGANDLQNTSQLIEPKATILLGDLQRSCTSARMSGSGSAYFAPVAHETDALRIATELRQKHYRSWAVHSIERHPLHDFAEIATISGFAR